MTLQSIEGNRNIMTATKKKVVASILSSEVPETFPTTGEDIKGLGPEYYLLPGSTIYVVNGAKLYMADESMNWIEQ